MRPEVELCKIIIYQRVNSVLSVDMISVPPVSAGCGKHRNRTRCESRCICRCVISFVIGSQQYKDIEAIRLVKSLEALLVYASPSAAASATLYALT